MLARQRQEHILERVAATGGVRVADVVEELGISEMTVRRDITELVTQGLVERVHGGAVAAGPTTLPQKKGEVVVIQVDPNLDQHGEAMFFNKANGSVIRASLGYCMASNDKVSCQFVPITYEPGIGRKAKYSVSITQSSSEVAEFRKFFKEGL